MILKPVREQVIVITGASSGIGLVTARQAAARGACVVLAARNAADLEHAVEDIRRRGGRAEHVVADVADERQVEAIAETAVRAAFPNAAYRGRLSRGCAAGSERSRRGARTWSRRAPRATSGDTDTACVRASRVRWLEGDREDRDRSTPAPTLAG